MKTKPYGFTLVELMIIVVVAAILATLAMPSYQAFIRKTRLANVRSELIQNAATLERYYTQKGTFVGIDDNSLVQNEYFKITFAKNGDFPQPANGESPIDIEPNPSDSGFILKAVPTSDYATESCTVYLNDSGIFWASSNSCPGYEEPHK